MTEALRSIGVILRIVWRADKPRTILSFILFAVNGLWLVFNALWLKIIVDAAVESDMSKALWAVAGLMITSVLGMVANWTGVVVLQRLRERVGWLIDKQLIDLSSGIPHLEHHERPDYLKEMDLLRREKGNLSGVVQTLVVNFQTLLQGLAVGGLLAYLHRALLLLPLFAVPSLVIGSRVEAIRQRTREETVEMWRGADHLFELSTTAGPAKELRIFGLQEEIPDRHRQIWRSLDRIHQRASIKGAALSGGGWVIFAIGYIGAIVFVVLRAVSEEATPGDVILAVQLTGQINQQVSSAVSGVSNFIRDLRTVRRYQWLLNYAGEIGERIRIADPAPIPARIEKGVELKDLSFVYPGTETQVLSNVSLVLPAGSTVAIVGENGAGKTTLVKLLCRFYEPTSGAIEVDGIDLRRLPIEEWRRRISTGFQDFVRFELLARQTVGVGDLIRIDDAPSVEAALDRAGSGDVLTSLPSGLETQLGKTFEGGAELSGGQWQKLALGRAMMRTEPLLLILDEPTASLDAETEHALFEGYTAAAEASAEKSGAITILVSHRFSTVRMADLIVVIDGGRVVEYGRHQQLIQDQGLYADLYELQARRYR